jgi:asparagine synthase (glutamine-hydrolysing)
MPGIFGMVGSTPGVGLEALAASMARRMLHHSWYVTEQHIDQAAGLILGRVSLGYVNTAPQPAFNSDRSLAAVMHGEVYDVEEHLATLRRKGCQIAGSSQAELLLHGYSQDGPAFGRSVQGEYVAAFWNARERQLTLTGDRFGMKPLYYAHLPGRLLFASQIKALLVEGRLSRGLDPRGVAQFFTFGQLLNEDTLLADVRLLPRGCCLIYDVSTDQVRIERYWAPASPPQGTSRPRGEVLDGIAEAFKRAVDRRTTGSETLGLALSGGLDSRTILGAVDSARPVRTVCLGMEGSIDHRLSEQMAARTGRSHHRYTLSTGFLDRFEEHMRYMVHLTDGQYLCQCIVMPTLPLYRELGIQALLRGHAGELMHMEKAYNFSMDRAALALSSRAELEAWLFRRLQAYLLDNVSGALFTPIYQEEREALARQSLQQGLAELDAVEPAVHRIWHLFISQRLRRETALSMVEFGSVVETRLPYLDSDLIDALMAAPPELKFSEAIQEHILRRYCPALLEVVNANTGTAIGASRLARTLAKLRLKVLAKLGVKGYQPYERLGLWLRRELRPFVERTLLARRCLDRGIFHPLTVHNVVTDHLEGKENHTFLLLALLVFEIGQQQFVDGEEYVPAHNSAAGSVPRNPAMPELAPR